MNTKSKKIENDVEQAAANANRRKRRAERNHMRSIKHAHKLLEQISEGVSTSFNHLGWTNAAAALKQVSMFVTPEEYSDLGEAWRDTYASEIPSTQIEIVVHKIKDRISGNVLLDTYQDVYQDQDDWS